MRSLEDLADDVLTHFDGMAEPSVIVVHSDFVEVGVPSWANRGQRWWVRLIPDPAPAINGGTQDSTRLGVRTLVGWFPSCAGTRRLLHVSRGVITASEELSHIVGVDEPLGPVLARHLGVLEGLVVLGMQPVTQGPLSGTSLRVGR